MLRKRYPAVRQYDRVDCGPAALLSVLRFFGGDFPLPDVRRLAGTTASGSSMAGLTNAARHLGLKAEGAVGTFDELRAQDQMPFLAHTEREGLLHFLVVYELGDRYVLAADPAQGLVRMRVEEFQECWTGAVLFVSPDGPLQRKSPPHWTRWMLEHCRPILVWIQQAHFLGVVYSGLGIVMSLFIRWLQDGLIPSGHANRIVVAGFALLVVGIIQACLGLLRQLFVLDISRRLGNSVTGEFLERLFHLPHDFFASRRMGDLTARAHDIGRIQSAVADLVGSSVLAVTVAVTSLIAVWVIARPLALAAVFLIPAYALILATFAARLKSEQREVMKAFANTEATYLDHLSCHEDIRLNGWVEWAVSRTVSAYRGFQDSAYALGRRHAQVGAIAQGFGSLLTVALLVFGGRLVVSDGLTVGSLVAAYSLLAGIVAGVSHVVGTWVSYQGANVAAERLRDLLLVEPESTGVGRSLERMSTVSLRGLSFDWPSGDPLFQNVDVTLEPGVVALAGRNGVGKSTLARILTRQLAPSSGEVLINSARACEFELASYRRCVAVVAQESRLFRSTVLENLNPTGAYSTDHVRDSIMNLGLHSAFHRPALDLGRPVGERGCSISAGERQIIGLTRALLTKPSVLILDEALAVLDIGLRKMVFETLRRYARKNIVLLISHHGDQLRSADRLLVLHARGIQELPTPSRIDDSELVRLVA